MKKIYTLLLAIPLLFAAGCQDNLELSPLNEPSYDTFFSNFDDFQLFVNSTYKWSVPSASEMTIDYGSDISMANRGNEQFQTLVNGNLMPNSGIVGRYFNYESIRHAYTYFKAVSEFVGLTAEQKATLDGQVYYMLAYRYFAMFRAYENVPVVTELLELENADVACSDKELVFAEALKNVELAINSLPSERSERGRLTKLVAMTLKTDMLLYTASRYDETINGATYLTALEAANSALAEADTQGYGLAESYPGLFLASLQSSDDAQKEIILENVRLKDIAKSDVSSRVFRLDSEGGEGVMQGSQVLVDKFPCTDGIPINKSTLYDPQRPFENRDPRLGYNVLYPGAVISYVDNSKFDRIFNSIDPDAGTDYVLSNDLSANKSGYAALKYWDREGHGMFDGYASNVIYRYAELLLMAAEAENEASGPSSTVYQRISKIRQRTGVDLPAVDGTMYSTQAEVRSLIRDERAIELAFEGKRYWDLKRWGIAETVLNTDMKSINIASFNSDGTFNSFVNQIYVRTDIEDSSVESLFDVPDSDEGGRTFATYLFIAPKHYVWPIPENILTRSEMIEQHPLWK